MSLIKLPKKDEYFMILFDKISNKVKGIIDFFSSLGIAKKLIYIYILIIAIPVLSLSFYTFYSLKESFYEQIFNDTRYSLDIISNNINFNVETFQRIENVVSTNKDLIEFLNTNTEMETIDIIDFVNTDIKELERLQFSNPNIRSIRIFTDNKYILERWSVLFAEHRIKDTMWYKKLQNRQQNSCWQLNHIDDLQVEAVFNSSPQVSYYKKLGNPQKEDIGYLQLSMNSADFFPEMYKSEDTNSAVFIITKNSHLMYENYENEFVKKNRSAISYIKSELIKNTNAIEGHFLIKLKDIDLAVAYKYNKALDIYVYKVVSTEFLLEKIKNTRSTTISISIVVMIIASFLVYISTLKMLKNLKLTVQYMRKVQKGELQVEIPVRGRDELSELAHHFNKMIVQINQLIINDRKKHEVKKKAEVRALQTQINAHFIYNVLETIKMDAEIKEQFEISDSITSLGKLMRYSMRWKNHQVKLRQEIDYIKNYIKLLNLRYDYYIHLYLDIDEALYEREVLKMTIQPIVENAIKHGIVPMAEDSVIKIKVYIREQKLVIEITDNGIGISPTQLTELKYSIESGVAEIYASEGGSNGIGLVNINERIKIFYGEEYELDVISKEGCYTKVILTIPCLDSEEEVLNEKAANC